VGYAFTRSPDAADLSMAAMTSWRPTLKAGVNGIPQIGLEADQSLNNTFRCGMIPTSIPRNALLRHPKAT